MTAIGYIRISTVDQSTYSLEFQEAAVRKYCTDNNLNLLAIFKDNGESSYTFDRPDWKALEAFIKKNKQVTHLIIYDHDRFSRNLAEALLKIKELQDKFGIKVLATTDRIDTDMADPSTYIMRAFRYMIAESELLRIRERIKAGIMHAFMNGYFPNLAPYGYKNSRTEDKKPALIIDPEKARIVKEIFRLRLQGKSPEAIRAAVRPMGFNRSGNDAIQRILANPVYAGLIKVPAYKNRPEYLTKGKHKAIIPENDYWEVQTGRKPIAIQNKDEVPLRGVLKCWCGKPVTAGNSKGRKKYYWYYLCSTHRQSLSAEKLHNQLNEILSKLSFSPDDVAWFRERFTYEIAAMLQHRAEELGATERDLKAINAKIAKTEERYLSNQNISPETFQKVIGEMKVQKNEIEKRKLQLSATSADYMKVLESVLPKLADLSQAYNSMSLETKQRFLRVFFGDSLSYSNGSYRTAFIHPLIELKAAPLKENGLLIKEQPVVKLGKIPIGTRDGS